MNLSNDGAQYAYRPVFHVIDIMHWHTPKFYMVTSLIFTVQSVQHHGPTILHCLPALHGFTWQASLISSGRMHV